MAGFPWSLCSRSFPWVALQQQQGDWVGEGWGMRAMVNVCPAPQQGDLVATPAFLGDVSSPVG